MSQRPGRMQKPARIAGIDLRRKLNSQRVLRRYGTKRDLSGLAQPFSKLWRRLCDAVDDGYHLLGLGLRQPRLSLAWL